MIQNFMKYPENSDSIKNMVSEKMDMWVFPKIMVPPNHPFVHRVFHYFHHPFWGTIIFGNIHIKEL